MTNKIFIVPGELTDLNSFINAERGNKFVGNNVKQNETYRCMMAVMSAMNKGLEINSKIDIYFHWHVPNRRKDKDNISFAKKFVLDGMQKANLIPNDNHKWIGNFRDYFYIDKDNPRVVVELFERK